MRPEARPELRLALLCAGTATARAGNGNEADHLIDVIDWNVLEEALRERRLLALVGERVLALAGGRAPRWFADVTTMAVATGYEHDAFLQLISLQLTSALAGAGIRSVALKGPRLGEAIYGVSGRRPSRDIDLLVADEDLPHAVEVAKRHGYCHPRDHTSTDGLPLLHFTLHHQRPSVPRLELHWRVHWYERTFSRDLLMGSTEDAAGTLRPAAADELATLLLIYARDGFLVLRTACDLAAWWDRFGAQLPAGSIGELIIRYPPLERPLLAALAVAKRVVGIPSDGLVPCSHRLEARVRLAAAIANPTAHGSPQILSSDPWLMDWLLSPRGGRIECVRRQLLEPAIRHDPLTTPRRHPFTSAARGARLTRAYLLRLQRVAVRRVRRRCQTRRQPATRRIRRRRPARGASVPCSRS